MLVRIDDLAKEAEEDKNKIINLSSVYETALGQEKVNRGARLPGIHPSEVSKCPRKVWYTLRGTETIKSIQPKWRKKFQHGQAVHEMLQKNWKEIAKDSGGLIGFQDEVPINPYTSEVARIYNIQGSCDGVITLRKDVGGLLVDDVRTVLEIKTVRHKEFESRKAPDPDHVEQAHIYMACLDIPYAWMVYFDKDSEDYSPPLGNFLVKFNMSLWGVLEDRFRGFLESAKSDKPPTEDEGIYCMFCGYSWTCKPRILNSFSSKSTVPKAFRRNST